MLHIKHRKISPVYFPVIVTVRTSGITGKKSRLSDISSGQMVVLLGISIREKLVKFPLRVIMKYRKTQLKK